MAESHDMRDSLLQLYDELDAEIAAAGPVCELSGRCCRFEEYGHTLFLSQPEADLLAEESPPTTGPVDETACPYQVDRLCQARERRPMGCRVYFCDPKYAGRGEELSERYIARLKQLHGRHGTAWDYRPLHRFLAEDPGRGEKSTVK